MSPVKNRPLIIDALALCWYHYGRLIRTVLTGHDPLKG